MGTQGEKTRLRERGRGKKTEPQKIVKDGGGKGLPFANDEKGDQ